MATDDDDDDDGDDDADDEDALSFSMGTTGQVHTPGGSLLPRLTTAPFGVGD